MKIAKKIALSLFTAVISSYAFADIIELDTFNPDHCRQQILQSKDELPVIASYSTYKYDDNSKMFMKEFKKFANSHPEKTFFTWDAEKDALHLTQTLCLQQLGLIAQPNIVMLGVFKADDSGPSFMSAPFRSSWAGNMTVMEMNKFIDVSDYSMKKAVLAQKNR